MDVYFVLVQFLGFTKMMALLAVADLTRSKINVEVQKTIKKSLSIEIRKRTTLLHKLCCLSRSATDWQFNYYILIRKTLNYKEFKVNKYLNTFTERWMSLRLIIWNFKPSHKSNVHKIRNSPKFMNVYESLRMFMKVSRFLFLTLEKTPLFFFLNSIFLVLAFSPETIILCKKNTW